MSMTKQYQPKTGARCGCKRGMERDNCPTCEGTGWQVDFAAIRARNSVAAKVHASGCDGEHCAATAGQIRVLPVGGDGNALLCRACFDHEMKFRRHRNFELGRDAALPLVKWDTLKIYGE